VDYLQRDFAHCRLLCVIQTYEITEPESLVELQGRFEWSALRIYNLNAPGENHGVVLGTSGWKPCAVLRHLPDP
jgi:hypothetical protein